MQSTTKLIKEQKMLLLDKVEKAFIFHAQHLTKHPSTSLQFFGKMDSQFKRWHAWETYETKGVSSDNVALLTLKGEQIYKTFGIATSGNDLPLEQKKVSLCIKDTIKSSDEEHIPTHQIVFISKKLSLVEFRAMFNKFISHDCKTLEDIFKTLVNSFEMQEYLNPITGKQLTDSIKKYNFYY